MDTNLSEQEPELLAALVANYTEYSGSLGAIDIPADFDLMAMIVDSK
jgi:hypothetical protein